MNSTWLKFYDVPRRKMLVNPFGFAPPPVAGTDLVTALTYAPLDTGTLAGEAGMIGRITGSDILINALGAFRQATWTGNRYVKLYGDPLGTPFVIASAIVDFSAGTPGVPLFGTVTPVLVTLGTNVALQVQALTGEYLLTSGTTYTHTGVFSTFGFPGVLGGAYRNSAQIGGNTSFNTDYGNMGFGLPTLRYTISP